MNQKTQRIALIGMFCAISYALMVIGRVPVVLFLKYDPKDVMIVIGGFLLGPFASLYRNDLGQRYWHHRLYYECAVKL